MVITGLPGDIISAGRDPDADDPVDRRRQFRLVELRLKVGDCGLDQGDLRVRQDPLFGDRTRARRGGLRALQVEIGSRLGERGRAFVELLAAGEIPGGQGNCPCVLLLSREQIGLGRAHGLHGNGNLLGSHSRVDPVALRLGASSRRLCLADPGRKVWMLHQEPRELLGRG